MYKRVLLKLSGEALSDGKGEPFSQANLDDVALEVKNIINDGIGVCIVSGGGNLYRGKIGATLGMERVTGDAMGMLATVMNCLAISNSLTKANIKNKIYCSFPINGLIEQYNVLNARKDLDDGVVVLFAGGTGHPYFSTDTCSALRALECNCDAILVAKNGVDGIYDADPRNNPNAKRYDEVTYREILNRNLQVMDLTSISLCQDNNMPLFVFNMNKKGNIYKACKGEIIGTKVH